MDNDKTAVNALATEPIAVKGNSTALESLMAEMLGDAFVLRKETKALLDSVKQEREFFIQAIQTERDTYKKAFFEVTSLIESQQAEMEIAVSAGVRRINEATTENAKMIVAQLEKNVNSQTTEHGNAAKAFFDKNTAQSLEAIEKAKEKAHKELTGWINRDFFKDTLLRWTLIGVVIFTIEIAVVAYTSNVWLNNNLRDEIRQATSQPTKTNTKR